jgi:hypothetical protein
LTHYPDPSRVNEIDAHKKWAELVTNLPGVTNAPSHPDFEIVPTVSNALAVYGHLLFHKKVSHLGATYLQLSPSKKLDLVCQVLSRPDRKVDWMLQGAESKEELDQREVQRQAEPDPTQDTNVLLEFSINGKPKYDWKITSAHAQVDPKQENLANWREKVGPEMAKLI